MLNMPSSPPSSSSSSFPSAAVSTSSSIIWSRSRGKWGKVGDWGGGLGMREGVSIGELGPGWLTKQSCCTSPTNTSILLRAERVKEISNFMFAELGEPLETGGDRGHQPNLIQGEHGIHKQLPMQQEQQPHRQKQRRSATSCLLHPHSPNLIIVSGGESNIHSGRQLIIGGRMEGVSGINFYINCSSLTGSYHSLKYFDE